MRATAFLTSLVLTSLVVGVSAAQEPSPGGPAPSTEGYAIVERDTSSDARYGASPPASSRGDTASFIAYDFGVPLGSMRDFTANVSPIGVELQFRGWVADRISLALSADWSSFVDERPRTTYSLENAMVTASTYNSLQMTNARLAAHYYLGQGNVRPYIGPHAGVGWSWFETEVADLALSDTQFSVLLGAELGALFGRDPSILGNLRYSWLPSADFLGVVSNVQTISAQVGIGL